MRNPYLLPEGPVLIAFSGGRTSGYLLSQIINANGGIPNRAIVSFQNTGREMPQTLDFVQEIGERWGVSIVWLEYRAAKPLFEVVDFATASRDGEPFNQLIAKKKILPNMHKKFCSPELKTLTAKRYLVSIGWRKWTSAVGYRADEGHRNLFVDTRSTGWTPLRTAGVSKHDVIRFWKQQPFDLRLPVVRGKTVGGNCDGCFLKSEAWIASMARDMPDRAAWWEDHEIARGHPFSDRYTRREMRNFMGRQGEFALSDEGALCQTDDGECTA
jgi:3'-phosphoadenosine 5'-phosphosulfate sulfotransferase (PAPS reductase)/FAD synthetase